MGTRSLTKVLCGRKEEPITCMYRQFDGYLDGHGQELAEWLSEYTVVNGISIDEKRKVANGMDCLAAQMFAHFKEDAGGIYCMHPDASDCGEEYLYKIKEGDNGEILLTVYNTWDEKEIFHGTPEELLVKTK